jgi:hypothetical protein
VPVTIMIMRRILAELQDARREIARLETEVDLWRDRCESAIADHEASIKQFDEEYDRWHNGE